jgi:predicted Zn finger-like uncharacterized protein
VLNCSAVIGRRVTNVPATFQCPKCAQRYALKEGMAGKTVKCPKCGETFRAPAADAAAPQQATPAKTAPVVAKPLPAAPGTAKPAPAAPAPSTAAPAPAAPAPQAAPAELLAGAASEAQAPGGAWDSPVHPQKRAAPPPLPAAQAAGKPRPFELALFNVAVVVIFVGLMSVCVAILGINAKWLTNKAVAMTVAIVGTCVACVALPLLVYAVRHNLLVGVPLVLGVAAILGAAWIFQPFTQPEKGPKMGRLRPPSADLPRSPIPAKTSPPVPGAAGATADADKRLDELADETIARLTEISELLASAKDAASAAAAFAKLPPLERRVGELDRERRQLQSQGARLSPQKQQQLDEAQRAFEAQQVERMTQQMPQYLQQMDELLKEVSPGGPPAKKQP